MPRRYDPADRSRLWELKRGFERELGAATGDAGKAQSYAVKLDDDYRERYLDWVDRCLKTEPDAIQVAEVAGSVVGYAFVLPERHALIWDAAVLNELYVEPSARGTGVGEALLEAAIDVARSQDLPLDRIMLDVDPGNEPARALYEDHGFEPWGELLARELTGERS
jgi:GNAT superfamily N-acetyltransferase